jgi:hypothetical protein
LDAVGSEKHGWGSRHNIDPKAYWFKDTPMRHFKPNYAFATVALSVALSSSAFAAAPVVKSGQTFMCTPTHVWDGDGPIWCEQGPRIRLAGIAAREMDGTCKPFHPCPDAAAEDARDALVSLVGLRIGVGQHGHILVTGPPCDVYLMALIAIIGLWPGVSPQRAETSIAKWFLVGGRYDGPGTGTSTYALKAAY